MSDALMVCVVATSGADKWGGCGYVCMSSEEDSTCPRCNGVMELPTMTQSAMEHVVGRGAAVTERQHAVLVKLEQDDIRRRTTYVPYESPRAVPRTPWWHLLRRYRWWRHGERRRLAVRERVRELRAWERIIASDVDDRTRSLLIAWRSSGISSDNEAMLFFAGQTQGEG